MTLAHINATQAQNLIKTGAVLVDIRDADEHARERIPAARNVPLSKLCDGPLATQDQTIIYHCRSGNRTRMNSELLAKAGSTSLQAYILDGGIEAWKKTGLPVHRDTKKPIEIMRQVQIAAGGLTVAGAVLGFTVDPLFYGLSAAVGAGLVFAGVTGTCAMASLLKFMPWNRQVA